MRGMTSPDSAMKSSAGHLLSFTGTATIPAIMWLEDYYNCDCTKEVVGKGVPSTEHSVMSSYGREGEFECYRHLIEDVFKTGPLSMVSDTYDYWNVITNYLPRLKDLIMGREGKIIIRGDSGDPVDIVCGTFGKGYDEQIEEVEGLTLENVKEYYKNKAEAENRVNIEYHYWYTRIDNEVYYVKCNHSYYDDNDPDCEFDSDNYYYHSEVDDVEVEKVDMTPEMKGTVELLWEIFGGHVNSKGYKVLDPHIGAIYGDGITIERATAIYERLEKKGFAVNNCTLGIGSYSYLGKLSRDSLGFALKCTNSVINDVEQQIYKDPITDKVAGENFKKSQKGMCYVYRNGEDILYTDEHTIEDMGTAKFADNLLETVFENGVLVKEYTLAEIRNTLHKGGF